VIPSLILIAREARAAGGLLLVLKLSP